MPQGSILGPLFFLIYINDLSENLKSTVKIFAYDTSIFHVVKDPNTSAEILNHDLTRISEWAYRWKMSFNQDPSKQAQEVLLSNKVTKTNHPNIIFNGSTVLIFNGSSCHNLQIFYKTPPGLCRCYI